MAYTENEIDAMFNHLRNRQEEIRKELLRRIEACESAVDPEKGNEDDSASGIAGEID